MKKKEYRIGPGAASLILVIVVLAMSIFALLSLSESDGRLALARRSMDFAEIEYDLSSRAERKLMELDAVLKTAKTESDTNEAYLETVKGILPEPFQMKEDAVSAVFSSGASKELYLEVRILPFDNVSSYEVTAHIFYAP